MSTPGRDRPVARPYPRLARPRFKVRVFVRRVGWAARLGVRRRQGVLRFFPSHRIVCSIQSAGVELAHLSHRYRLPTYGFISGFKRLRSLSCGPHVLDKKYRKVAVPDMMKTWGSHLEQLHLEHIDRDVVNAIASHCENLRHLKLSFRREPCRHPLDTLWERLGTKLEHLEMQSEHILGALARYCPNVLSVCTDAMDVDAEDVCKAYGEKLLDLKLLNCAIGNAGLARISETCPNAVVDCTHARNYGMPTDQVLALGRAAALWQMSTRDAYFDDGLFGRVGASCSNL